MKRKYIKRVVATTIAMSIVSTFLPVARIAMATTTGETVCSNDFESGKMPDKVNWSENLSSVKVEDIDSNKVLGFDVSYGGTSNWDSETSLCFLNSRKETIKANSVIQFDVIIPEANADFTGAITCGATLQDKNWKDKGKGYSSVSSSDLKKEASNNGYIRKTVSVKTDVDTEGLQDFYIQIAGYQCNYKGKIYVDNIKIISSEVKEDTANSIFSNDFQSGKLPDEVGGQITASDVSVDNLGSNKLMKFNSKFDGSTDWEKNKHEFAFYTNSSSQLLTGSTIQMDIIIPTENKNYTGQIKYTGGLGTHDTVADTWGWVSGSTGDLKSSDFEDLGNGYSKKTVSVETASDLAANLLCKVDLQITSYNCGYKGAIYIDNIKLSPKGTINEDVTSIAWNFDDATKALDRWSYGGNWDYAGVTESVVNYDESSKSMKLSLDYSNNSTTSWSEFKVINNLSKTTSFKGYNKLTYDFIYDPSKMSKGGFMSKLYISGVADTNSSINLDKAEDYGNGLKKVKVTLNFKATDASADSIILGIIGSNTDYKGNIYIDNIVVGYEKVVDLYVEKTAVPKSQEKVEVSSMSSTMPTTVKLVDSSAIEKTADLYAYLQGLGKTDKVIYGHQNDTHSKAVLHDSGSNSDTKDITGSISGICGIDALALTGAELQLNSTDKANGVDSIITKAANLSIKTANEGGIITFSAHMPNFAVVAQKGKDAKGNYDYSGYTPGVTTGDVVSRILPGGDLNKVYTGYLDMIAEYANKLENAGVPVIFRPFHENNGSWFWWGKQFCDEAAYKNMYRYTVEYLRDNKNVHNFLYVYSPNGTFKDEADYLSRYPGDEFVDILAFDLYDATPTADAANDPWLKSFKETINLVQGIADKKAKLSAVSETGVSAESGLPISGNVDKQWFSNIANIVSDSNMPYYMVWANFGEGSGLFSPYMISETKGHEMINDFIDFYNEDKSVFADGIGNYSVANTRKDSAYSYGFITSPSSTSRVLGPTKITASIKGYVGQIKFALKNKDGEIVETLNATLNNGVYSADITQANLNKIGQTKGSIELYSDDTKLDTISTLFNIGKAIIDPKVVDNFEYYYGDDELLQTDWTTNAGSGCSIIPKLEKDNIYGGKYGLEFNYKISTAEASEGWAGITKNIDADWSDCDVLQFWCKPDGHGQKLVIQVTSNGEDFEVKMPEFAATTEPKLITLKFSDFVGKKGGTLDLTKVSKMGVWCNTIIPKGNSGAWTVDSTMYFDDIKAVNTSKIIVDSEAPTAPANLTSDGITNNSVTLSWTASTDNTAVTNYEIYNGSILIGTSITSNYTVTELSSNTTYSFTVKAKDAASNVSTASSPLSITTTSSQILKGDVNGDKEIDMSDYILLQKYIMNNSYTINKENSDINGDGKINTADLFALRKTIINS